MTESVIGGEGMGRCHRSVIVGKYSRWRYRGSKAEGAIEGC